MFSKSTSPINFPSSFLFIPTSITTAPSFTISSVTKCGLPTAAINISAFLVIAFISLVFEWQIVIVAFLLSKHCNNGFPTILLLPIITTFFLLDLYYILQAFLQHHMEYMK